MQTLISYVRSGQPDLTNRQMALLMLVYLTPGPHTVRGLAHILGVSKPVITRADVGKDGRSVRLHVGPLQEGHIHELHATGVRSADGLPLLHADAYYTANYLRAP